MHKNLRFENVSSSGGWYPFSASNRYLEYSGASAALSDLRSDRKKLEVFFI